MKRIVPLIFLVITIVFSIISIVLSIVAYAKWKKNADEYSSVLNNWRTTPIVNVSWESTTTGCPTGTERVGMGVIDYQQVFCEGDTNTTNYYCDAPVPAREGTEVFNTISEIGLMYWENSALCITRGGTNAIDRPLKQKSGFKSCGTNPQTGDFFFNENLPCPVTWFKSTPPSSGSYQTITAGTGERWYYSRDPAIGRPYLQFTGGEGLPCTGSYSENDGVRASFSDYPAGLNLTGAAFTVSNANGDQKNPFRTSHPQIGRCARTDNRFIAMDESAEEHLYNYNLKTNNGPILLSQYVYASDSLSVNWTAWNRPEILWKESCDVTREQVNNVEHVIDTVTATTLAVMIITLFAGCFDICFGVWGFKNAVDSDPENDAIPSYYQNFGNFCCTLGLIITTSVSFAFIAKAKGFFRAMQDADCSDSITNGAVRTLSKTALEIFEIWVAKMVLDILKILWYCYQIYKGREILPCVGKSSI